MRKEEKRAAEALRKAGKSYNQISKSLDVSKSTLHYWFKDSLLSKKIKKRLTARVAVKMRGRMIKMSRMAKARRKIAYAEKRREAEKSFFLFNKEKLFNCGLMIYWGEGDNKLSNGQIRVTNSNPLMLKLFYIFLKRYLPAVSLKAKMYLILYPGLHHQACERHWSKEVKIPLDKFTKSFYIKGRSKTRKLPYGIGTIIVSSRAFKEIMIRWLELKKLEIKIARV